MTNTASPRPQAQPPVKMKPQLQETHPRRPSEAVPGETVAEEVAEGGADRKEKGGGDPELTGDKGLASKVASGIVEGGDSAGVGGKKREGIERELPPEGFVPAEEMEMFDFSALQR